MRKIDRLVQSYYERELEKIERRKNPYRSERRPNARPRLVFASAMIGIIALGFFGSLGKPGLASMVSEALARPEITKTIDQGTLVVFEALKQFRD